MNPENTAHHVGRLRMEYQRGELDETQVPPNPWVLFEQWITEAIRLEQPEPHAMHLSTLDRDGYPAGRVVLLRGYDERGLTFYTNYLSDKGAQLEAHPKASVTFFWPLLERQIRISGEVARVDEAESDAYFESRPVESQLGAWASDQSRPMLSRDTLEQRMEECRTRFSSERHVPRPPHWGGLRLLPRSFEFWQGRRSRLHDRLLYAPDAQGGWNITRLYP